MIRASIRDTTLAESDATEQVEGNHYFPRDSVAMTHLRESDTPYTCPWKGDAQYYHLVIDGDTVEDVAWSYPDPKEAAAHIAGHLAFDRTKGVTIG